MPNEMITPAATVLVIRDSKDGIEVFLVERSNRPPFGNLYVFPGGKIDKSDGDPRALSLCRSISDYDASALLGIKKSAIHSLLYTHVTSYRPDVGRLILVWKRHSTD